MSRQPYLHLDPVVPVTQVLQVGGGVGLDGGEVMLQHVDDLRQLGVAPGKLPEGGKEEGNFQKGSLHSLLLSSFILFVSFCRRTASFSCC